jgi:hypothetical protein
VRALDGRLAEQHPVVGDDADRVPVDVRGAAHQRRAVLLLELQEAAAVDEPGDDLTDVVRRPRVGRHDRQQLLGVQRRRLDRLALPRRLDARTHRRHDAPDDRQRVHVVVGQVVGHA